MIRGYPQAASVAAGEVVWLRLSADVAAVHVAAYRIGGDGSPTAVVGPLRTEHYPDGRCDEAWDWPAYPLRTEEGWRSGAYVAYLLECRGGSHADCLPHEQPAVDGRDGRAVFVVRSAEGAERAPLLYKIPLSTYHAYNATGGGSLYVGDSLDPEGVRTLTLSRPGGGSGGELSFPGAVDVYDPDTPREGVAHWDLPFLTWLDRAGYRFDVCTDLDLDRDPGLLVGRTALVSAGHDEYWTAGTREAVERFVRAGGSAAFFAGNLCFWRVGLDRGTITCRHPPVASADCDQWWRIRSETALSGVSYVNGGGWWSGPRDPVGYSVVDPGHWVYDGTGVVQGDVFGAEQRLVGYECDGAPLDPHGAGGVRAVAVPGEPDVHLLGVARLGPGWQDRPTGDRAAATMVVTAPGGTVFTAGTTDWPRLLAAGEPVVEQVTRNVLDRFSLPARRLHAPDWARAGTGVPVWVDADIAATVDWRASAGQVHGDGPLATLVLPQDTSSVTVSAFVHESGGTSFATRTIPVLTVSEAAQVDLLTAVRDLVQQTPPDPHPAEPPGPGNRPLSDARWHPLRDGLRRPLTVAETARIGELATLVGEAAAVATGALSTGPGHHRLIGPAPVP